MTEPPWIDQCLHEAPISIKPDQTINDLIARTETDQQPYMDSDLHAEKQNGPRNFRPTMQPTNANLRMDDSSRSRKPLMLKETTHAKLPTRNHPHTKSTNLLEPASRTRDRTPAATFFLYFTYYSARVSRTHAADHEPLGSSREERFLPLFF